MFSPLERLVFISLISDSTVTSTSTFGMPVLSEILLIRSDLRMAEALKIVVFKWELTAKIITKCVFF